ncbi:hypothetical protein O0I10_011765 [Lichtheimia ornata]|uniref:Uncharacterized protein n=1 Tax=Lichtheimia ornata TaxID=688661 RepID=A0AAD7UTV1_9FUNG|nr:uncharacterized protein O0I10_011765 [Lichtheimia ornata]KAJ8652619.1 hypothetical protein O0I10_011765 [Lichtheimia ornata]
MEDLFWVNLSCLLEERSLALLKWAQFDMALRDTNAILTLDPTLALDYRSYLSYCGRQQKVIEVFEQDLNIESGMDDDERQHYQYLLDAAMIQQKDVDLPFPVVSTSIVPLLMDDERCNLRRSCPYPQVSKSFRRVGVNDLDMTSCAM